MQRRCVSIVVGAIASMLTITGYATTEADDTYVVAASSQAATPMAAWYRSGRLLSANDARSVRRAPRKAVRYEQKSVTWPTATVKQLTFRKQLGGVLHPLTDETLLYVLEGRIATTVNGERVTLEAGDVASLPSGRLENSGEPNDAIVIAWTAASLVRGATPAVVRSQAVAGQSLGLLQIRRYEFPGNSVRAVQMTQGYKTNPNSAKADSLIVVTQGPMQFHQNGREFTVTAGDFIREVAGLQHHWNVATGAAGFVTTSALPVGAAPIDPSQATDRPK